MTLKSRVMHDKLVALLAEGVDRNADASNAPGATGRSPSSRRVWIEKVPPKYKVPLPIL